MIHLFRQQPRAFHMIFMLELWERFGYYTVQGVLTLFFIRSLGYTDVEAYYTFGAFSALIYSMVVIGGYLGDNVLGTKRTIVVGLTLLVLGYLSLALSNQYTVFYSLGLICVGNGLFKANPANLLSKCYEPNDRRLQVGFTLYYMSINLGSIAALYFGPLLSSRYGYPYAFMMSVIGLLLGLTNYWYHRNTVAHISTIADKKTVGMREWFLVCIGVCFLTVSATYLLQHVMIAKNLVWCVVILVVSYYAWLAHQEQKSTQLRMFVALVLMIEAVMFFTLYQQMPTSITLFAVHHVNPVLFGMPIDPQSFQILNPIWIVFLSPILAYAYIKLQQRGIAFSISYKYALGMTLCAVSFFTLYATRYFYTGQDAVSSWWLVGSYLFQCLGEILVSALGVAMVAELVPSKMTGFVMGMWFLTSAVAGFSGAIVGSWTALPRHMESGVASFAIYTDAFGLIGLIALGASIMMWLLAPKLNHILYPKDEDLLTFPHIEPK
jgi:proton-dependent oligopeptide transporter, POT family